MGNFWKRLWLAPLVGGLILTTSSCSSQTAPEENVIPENVNQNIEQTVERAFEVMESEDFMEALAEIDPAKPNLGEYNKEMGKIDQLVADDESLQKFYEKSKSSIPNDDEKFIKQMGKASIFMSLFYSHNLGERDFSIEADPTGFEKNGDSWLLSKEGAIAFKDSENRYISFVQTSDNLSFADDGNKFTLAALVKEIDRINEVETPAYNTLNDAITYLMGWVEKDDNKLLDKDLGENQDEVFKDFTLPKNMNIKIEGNLDSGFVVHVEDSTTKEIVSFNSTTGNINSSKQPSENKEYGQSTAYKLFNEYIETFDSSVEEKEEYATFEEMPELLNGNDKNNDYQWRIEGENEGKALIAKHKKQEYRFTDMTGMYDSTGMASQEELETEAGKSLELEMGDLMGSEQ